MRKSWLMAIVAIVFGLTFPMTFLKVPPTMVLLIKQFNISLTAAGLLMTVPAIAIMIAAIPGGILVHKIGAKNTMFVALGCALVGNVLGAISDNFGILLVARAFDGTAFSIAGIAIPDIISMWFPAQKRGLPMSLFSLWVGVGMLILFNGTAGIVAVSSWRGVWWSIATLGVILGIVFALVVRSPKPGEGSGETDPQQAGPKVSVLEGFKLPIAWLLGIIDFLYTVMFAVFNNYYATYLQDGVKLDLGTANHLYGYTNIGAIVGGLAIGFLLNKVNKKNHPLVLIAIIIPVTIGAFMEYQITSVAMLIPFFLFVGVFNQTIPPILYTIGPNMSPRPEMVGPIMAVITLGQSLGGIIGPMLVGPLVESPAGNNWGALAPLQLGIMVAALVFAVILMRMSTKKVQASNLNQHL